MIKPQKFKKKIDLANKAPNWLYWNTLFYICETTRLLDFSNLTTRSLAESHHFSLD